MITADSETWTNSYGQEVSALQDAPGRAPQDQPTACGTFISSLLGSFPPGFKNAFNQESLMGFKGVKCHQNKPFCSFHTLMEGKGCKAIKPHAQGIRGLGVTAPTRGRDSRTRRWGKVCRVGLGPDSRGFPAGAMLPAGAGPRPRKDRQVQTPQAVRGDRRPPPALGTWWCRRCGPGRTSAGAPAGCTPRRRPPRSTRSPWPPCSRGCCGTGGPGSRTPTRAAGGSSGRSGPPCRGAHPAAPAPARAPGRGKQEAARRRKPSAGGRDSPACRVL